MSRVLQNGDGVVSRNGDSETDDELMQQIADGSHEAFRVLYGRYFRRLCNFICRALSDYHRAEDIAQEAFLRVFCHAGRYRRGSSFSTWLFAIASNLARNEIRYRGRHRHTFSIDAEHEGWRSMVEMLPDHKDRADDVMEHEELGEALGMIADGLPPKYHTALVLRDIKGLSYEEVGNVLNIPSGTVRSRINRARTIFAEHARPYFNREGDLIMAARAVVTDARQGGSAARATSAAARATLLEPWQVHIGLKGAPPGHLHFLQHFSVLAMRLEREEERYAVLLITGIGDGSLMPHGMDEAARIYTAMTGRQMTGSRIQRHLTDGFHTLHRAERTFTAHIQEVNSAVREVAQRFHRQGVRFMDKVRASERTMQEAAMQLATPAALLEGLQPTLNALNDDHGSLVADVLVVLMDETIYHAPIIRAAFQLRTGLDGTGVSKNEGAVAALLGPVADAYTAGQLVASALQRIQRELGNSMLQLDDITEAVRAVYAEKKKRDDAAEKSGGASPVASPRDPYVGVFDGVEVNTAFDEHLQIAKIADTAITRWLGDNAEFFRDVFGVRWDLRPLSPTLRYTKYGLDRTAEEARVDELFAELERHGLDQSVDQEGLAGAMARLASNLNRPVLPDATAAHEEGSATGRPAQRLPPFSVPDKPFTGKEAAEFLRTVLTVFRVPATCTTLHELPKYLGSISARKADTILRVYSCHDGSFQPRRHREVAREIGTSAGAVQQQVSNGFAAMRAAGMPSSCTSESMYEDTEWCCEHLFVAQPEGDAAAETIRADAPPDPPQPERGTAPGQRVDPVPVSELHEAATNGREGPGGVDIDERDDDLALVGSGIPQGPEPREAVLAVLAEAPAAAASAESAAAVPSPSANGTNPREAPFSITILPPGVGEEITIVGTREGTLIRHKR